MNKSTLLIVLTSILLTAFAVNWGISRNKPSKEQRNLDINTRIDNLNYWVKKAEKGLIPFNPEVKVPASRFTGSKVIAFSVLTDDSPDVPVTDINSTQSENSVFVDPNNPEVVLNSNNSTQNPVGNLYGANDLFSFNAGETWEGEVEGAGSGNSGDPTTAIGLNGRWYVNYISNPGGMGISYSDDQGSNWSTVTIAPNPGQLADKNHMWIDNNFTSPYNGNLYVAWTDFGGAYDSQVVVSVSTDNGLTWSLKKILSQNVSAGSHNQGVNLSVGPNGEVYAIWTIYDSWPSDESAIGFAKSLDGGITWEPGIRAISNIRGIRTTGVNKNMRVNSFPSATVDISNGSNSGNIYITWANIGVPGINTGNDVDVYLASSSDQGESWTTPLKVNQDAGGLGKKHYFPWIASDPSNGTLSVIFYDDREVSNNELEVFCANSDDGGLTWEDFKVSDVAFIPVPIPGLADSYFGDYLGITVQDSWVYPVWTDNRNGTTMAYCSPYQLNPLNKPINLTADLTFETGICDLTWSYEEADGFVNFNLYRNEELIATTSDTTFSDQLTDYGVYTYKVTAAYTEDRESGASRISVQWGDAHIAVTPLSLYEHLMVDSLSVKTIQVINTGQLDLSYSITPMMVRGDEKAPTYCDASGGGTDEYISRVQVGDIDNQTGQTNYGDYTNLSTLMLVGDHYPITVTNGDPTWDVDECGAWVDWNQDGEFTDDESIAFNGTPGVGPYTGDVTPPVGAITGVTRMRVRIVYSASPEPCGTTSYGEVEDYNIFVQGWLAISPMEGNIAPGDTTLIEVGFDATGMDEGTYLATAHFYSNDPLVEDVVVPIQLDISAMMVMAGTADGITTICSGTELQLTAETVGSVSNLSYYWSSSPAGFESSEQNPIITPDGSAWYHIVAFNDSITAVDSIYITVVEYPNVQLGTDTVLCGENFLTLDAGNSGEIYTWSTGETTQTIVAEGTGLTTIWVNVSNETGCLSSDTIHINFASNPQINLGADTLICGEGSLLLDAGNPDDTYLWSTQEETQTIVAQGVGPTTFWVDVTNAAGCMSSDTIHLNFASIPEVNLGADTVFCGGGSLTLDAGNTGSTYLWSNGETSQTIQVDSTGYGYGLQAVSVEVTTESGCVNNAEVNVEFKDCTSISEKEAISLNIYPNPGNGIFNLELNSLINQKVFIKLTNLSGAVVYEEADVTISNTGIHHLNLSALSNGVYQLSVIGKHASVSDKLVINK